MEDTNTPAVAAETQASNPATEMKALRKALKLNQQAFAARLGISQSMVCFMEKGLRPISDETKKVMSALEAAVRA